MDLRFGVWVLRLFAGSYDLLLDRFFMEGNVRGSGDSAPMSLDVKVTLVLRALFP